MGLLKQQTRMRHFKHTNGQAARRLLWLYVWHGVGAPLPGHQDARYRAQTNIKFDHKTIADSSLMPSKKEDSITRKDWNRGTVTMRGTGKVKYFICGEKLLTMNSQGQIVTSRLLPSINSHDANAARNILVTPALAAW